MIYDRFIYMISISRISDGLLLLQISKVIYIYNK